MLIVTFTPNVSSLRRRSFANKAILRHYPLANQRFLRSVQFFHVSTTNRQSLLTTRIAGSKKVTFICPIKWTERKVHRMNAREKISNGTGRNRSVSRKYYNNNHRMDHRQAVSLCTLIRCSETVSNSFEDYIMLPEVKQLHSSVRNYSTAPIKLTKKLGIRSRYQMFVYTSNNRIQYQ